MKLIVGLGNPGPEYDTTRHNVGFLVLEGLRQAHRAVWARERAGGYVFGAWQSGATTIHLMRPMLMMNRSGAALADAVKKWDVAPQDILIVCDDVNLPLGTLRLRPQGSAGGHHGLASCLETLQTDAVSRLRIGVGIESLPKDLTDFVLSPFQREEQQRVETDIIPRAVEACEQWSLHGIEVAMNRVNP